MVVESDGGHGVRARRPDSIWDTFYQAKYRVLIVARTMTSTYRLLEAAEWFRDDFRVELFFTVDDGSAFGAGVAEFLRSAGAVPIPWEQIQSRELRIHLTLAASENVDFEAIGAPAVLLAHGVGFNKFIPTGSGRGRRLAGLPPERALRTGKVTIALSHPEQSVQLHAASPETAGRTAVVGDPTFDRLYTSRHLRYRYRAALGTGQRTLIVIASTWGRDSLIGRWKTLPAQLLAALDAGTYQVVTVLHPNVWSRHGRHQIELWLASALDAGMILMPPDTGWQAALLAADQVVSDHGSLGLFAAALDRPLMMAGPAPESVPGTPVAELAETVPRLHPDHDLRAQLETARRAHRPGRYDHITSRVLAHTGRAISNIQALIYRRLGLTPPEDTAPVRRIPIPECRARTATSHLVRRESGTAPVLVLMRYPAAVARYATDTEYREHHLVADETELDPKIVERAAVLTREIETSLEEGRRWGRGILAAYPGARLAVTPTAEGMLGIAAGARPAVQAVVVSGEPVPVQVVASAIYYFLLDPGSPNRVLPVRTGSISVEVAISPER